MKEKIYFCLSEGEFHVKIDMDQQYFLELVAKGYVERAINELLAYSQTLEDDRLYFDLIQVSARYNGIEREHRAGRLFLSEYRIESAKILEALKHYIREGVERGTNNGNTSTTARPTVEYESN